MKFKRYKYTLLAACAMCFLAGCSPDDYELGNQDIVSADLAEGIAYEVTVNQTDNSVELKSLMPSNYQVCWNHPQGYSQDADLTLRIPFAGSYSVTFGVQTRGGVVYGEPYSFTLDNTNGALLTDPLWEKLSGGSGKSKTWVLDVDAQGKTTYFVGPLFFYGTDDTWEQVTEGKANFSGADSWNWQADWAGNGSWLFGSTGAMDYGSMTFDLIDGAHCTVVDNNAGTTSKGTYVMDTERHTLSLANVAMLHDPGRTDIVSDWRNLRILSLTDKTMQLAVLRDKDPNEGPCLLVYNFVEKTARESYDPNANTGGNTDVQITDPYTDPANDDLTTTTTTTKNWTMNADAPYDWYWWNAADAQWTSNGFKSASDYNKSWTPAPGDVSSFKLTMTKGNDTGGMYVLTDADGNTTNGTYSVDGATIKFDKTINFYTVSNDLTTFSINTNELRIVNKKSLDNGLSELWLGVPNKHNTAGKVTEYAVIKLDEVSTGGAVQNGTQLMVDQSKLHWGDLEGKGNLRIEIFNAYGSGTAANPPIDVSKLKFNKSMAITFTVTGLGTLDTPCTAFIMWSPSGVYDASYEGCVTASVTGDGTYTVKVNGKYGVPDAGSLVYLIEIPDAGKHTTADLTPGDDGRSQSVQVNINSIWLDHTEE